MGKNGLRMDGSWKCFVVWLLLVLDLSAFNISGSGSVEVISMYRAAWARGLEPYAYRTAVER